MPLHLPVLCPLPCSRHGALPRVHPCDGDALTLRYGDAFAHFPPVYSPGHNDRIAHRNGDVPWAYSRWYDSFGVRSIILPAIDRLPDGAGEFPPNLPAAARVAMTRNAAAFAFAACPSVSPT